MNPSIPFIDDCAAAFLHRQGVVVTGSGCSQWTDQANSNHLTQSTDSRRPTVSDDGLLFDGSNDRLNKSGGFTLVQPESIYIRFRQLAWIALDSIFDGVSLNTGKLRQGPVTPDLRVYAGALGDEISDMAIGVFATVTVVINGASSSIAVNDGAPVVSDFGSADMNGLILGCSGAVGNFSNIEVKDFILYSGVAHTSTQQREVRQFINRSGGGDSMSVAQMREKQRRQQQELIRQDDANVARAFGLLR